jgi:hypothetical protein
MSNTRSALTLTALMLFSLLVGAVAAEIADGDGTNGIDRNPTEPEQDASAVDRTYIPNSGLSTSTYTFDPTMKRTGDAGAVPEDALFTQTNHAWTINSPGGVGDSANFADATAANSFQTIEIGNTEYTQIGMTDTADGTAGDSVSMKLQNWYGAIDRTTPHGVGSEITGAKTQEGGCTSPAYSDDVITCAISGDGGIDAGLDTAFSVRGSAIGGDARFGYAIHAPVEAEALYFGIDYTVVWNTTVSVNGNILSEGNTLNVEPSDEITMTCADANCTNSVIRLGIPTAYNASGDTIPLADNDTLFNTSARISVYDEHTVKITFGLEEEERAKADGAIMYDPTVIIDTDEPGVRVGVVQDGGMSWCDAQWFLASCANKAVFDGETSDGVDALVLEMSLPLEGVYSMAEWGGYDSVVMNLLHTQTDTCYNGAMATYIIPPSDFSEVFSKNSAITYAATGDYYDVNIGARGFDSETNFGSANTDYCTGPTNGIMSTALTLESIEKITYQDLMTSASEGIYDIQNRMFEMIVIIEFKESTHTPAGGNVIAFDVNGNSNIVMKTTGGHDPLQTSSTITRSTNSTNQTNPAFATPYVMYYDGTEASDNVLNGRELCNFAEEDCVAEHHVDGAYGAAEALGGDMFSQPIGDFGYGYMGLQNDPEVRKNSIYLQQDDDKLSTIECGVAVADADVLNSKIEVFTDVDTSDATGAGQNGSGYPEEAEWKPYGVLNSNNSRWSMKTGANTGNLSVDNSEENANSNAVSYTGLFIDGDNYLARCTFIIESYDIQTENWTKTTITSEHSFRATFNGQATTGGGGDVGDDDEGWLEQLDGWDFLIIGASLVLIFISIWMISSGGNFRGFFDDRLAMIGIGVAFLHMWAAHHYYYDVADPIGEEFATILGTMGFVVLGASFYSWGSGTTSVSMRNWRYLIGGFTLIAVGIPTALTGIFNVESDLLADAPWTFPLYDFVAGIGALIGAALLVASATGIYRREGM